MNAVIPERNYNIAGFDIASSDLAKPGIREQLEPIVDAIHTRMGQSGHHPVIRITGHASESRRPGKGHDVYATQRADAVKSYLVGRGIPASWIETGVSRPSRSVATALVNATPDQKAAARSASVEIGMSERRPEIAERFGDPQFVVGKPRRWLPPVPNFSDLTKHIPNPVPVAKKIGEVASDALGMLIGGGTALLAGLALIGLDEVLEVARHIHGPKVGPASRKYLQKKVAEGIRQHHLFVQRLLENFVDAGINPHEYTVRVAQSLHDWIHATKWNPVIYTFFELHGGNPSAEDLALFVGEMMEAWGIEHLPVEPHDRLKLPK